MKFIYSIVFSIMFSGIILGQLYQGPEAGSVPSGKIVSTDSFTVSAPGSNSSGIKNKIPLHKQFLYEDFIHSSKSAHIRDYSLYKASSSVADSSILINSFEGIPQTNGVPPDPYIACGPSHIIVVVNSLFRIYDKTGKILKTIDAGIWFSNVIRNGFIFDPKISYDQYDKRWIMVWLDQDDNDKRGNYLISVSDDENPMGIWYNYIMPNNVNGSAPSDNWSDYQGVGYDKQAVYITANQWSFGGSFNYAKLRIISKKELYSNTGGKLEWKDIWNIKHKHPDGVSVGYFRPVRQYDPVDEAYFVVTSYYGGNALYLYKLINPVSNPVLSVSAVNIGEFSSPDNADQLGGSSTKIEIGGSDIKNEPVMRDGILYLVSTTSSGTENKYASIKFVSVDVFSLSVQNDITFGADGYWYYYPAVAIDKDHNVGVVFNRSGITEYPGAYYIYKSANSSEFSGSKPLQKGKANYVVVAGDRNRWGDYSGIWLDPADETKVWLYAEYAPGQNTWGTYVGQLQLRLHQKAFPAASSNVLNFNDQHINTSGKTAEIVIRNYGIEPLQITGAACTKPEFKITTSESLPLTLQALDSIVISVSYNPTEVGSVQDEITISNSSDNPALKIALKGNAFMINSARKGIIYGAAGQASKGELIQIDPVTGNGTSIGPTLFTELSGLALNPDNRILYAVYPSLGNTDFLWVNAEGGDAYSLFNSPLDILCQAFDADGSLYAVTRNSRLYKIGITTGDSTFIGEIGFPVGAMTINHADGQMWMTAGNSASVKDKLYKINKNNGDTLFSCRTGLNKTTNAIVFDNSGDLYGVTGTSLQISNLIKIDPASGSAVTIGPTGYKGIKSLTHLPGITGLDENLITGTPVDFSLKQNYPNPFNPNTVIEFSLPVEAAVKLSVFNLIGEEIRVLQSGSLKPGYHMVNWDATDQSGRKLSSGIYLYRIIVNTAQGKEYTESKKLLLLK